MPSHRWFFSLALILSAVPPVGAQSVISARSGVINLSDGAVWLDSRSVEQHAGRFEQMNNGSELRTENGRAEVILTPGVFLRVGENSGVRMVSNRLADTQVEFLGGSVVVDSMASSGSAPITMLYGLYQARIQKQGCYRFNANPAELKVENGEIELLRGRNWETVSAGHVVPLSGELAPRYYVAGNDDALDRWNTARNKSISENNLAANGADLSTVMDGWQNDPDAVIRALETSGYVPPLAGRTPLSTYAPLSIYSSTPPSYNYNSLYTYNPLLAYPGLTPYGMWGLGFGSTFGIYPYPMLRYLPYRGIGISSYRSTLPSSRPGIGGSSPVYSTPRAPFHPVSPTHIGGARVGGVGHR
jgi:hypothetical protein